MRVHRMTKDLNEHGYTDYENVNVKDIREVAEKYGQTNDTLELYDGDKLIARATWDSSHRCYYYATGKDVGTPFETWHK